MLRQPNDAGGTMQDKIVGCEDRTVGANFQQEQTEITEFEWKNFRI
jgi:hypothetical protein